MLIYFSLFSLFAYLLILAVFIIGWERLTDSTASLPCDTSLPVTLLVPFRNEVSRLPCLLSSIAAQSYRRFEVILVNDHSTDNFLPVIEQFRARIPLLKVINATGSGKKNALQEGMTHMATALIVCTDADCELPPDYLQTIVAFQQKEQAALILAPVRMDAGQSLLERLQALEFACLMASGAGAAAMGFPILANGANIAFTAETWEQSKDALKSNEISGDDMFLLMDVKRRGAKISFLKNRQAMVTTQPAPSLKAFFRQRSRWASKAKSYTDPEVILVGATVFLLSMLIVVFAVAACFEPYYWRMALLLFGLKTFADSLLLFGSASFFSLKRQLILIPLLACLYPFYTIMAIGGGLRKRQQWK